MIKDIDIDVVVWDVTHCSHDCWQCAAERDQITNDYKKLYRVYQEAKALIDSGYDGPFMGLELEALFSSVRNVEDD
jgi:hypothetical protein